jgi:AcrR family transcriptional regulator
VAKAMIGENHGVDPRVLRTRRALTEAMIQLATERSLAEITVADVAGRAGVNRATVYAHYQSLDEILLAALEEQVATIIETAAACPIVAPPEAQDSTPVHLVRLFEHLERNESLFGPLLGPAGSGRLSNGIRRRLADAWRRQLEAGPTGPIPVTLHANYLSGALLGVAQHWISSPSEDRPGAAQVAADTWILLQATAAGGRPPV